MGKKSRGFLAAAYSILAVTSLLVVLPFLLMLSSSFTDDQMLLRYGYTMVPTHFSADAYLYLFSSTGSILHSYLITIVTTAVGTAAGLMMTALLGYALSIPDLPYRRLLSFLVFFTLLFNGGLVPTYLTYTNLLRIKNTIWALIVPYLLINGFLVIIARAYFATGIPREVVEAARIDGASETAITFRIVLPMAVPILATIGLMTGLGYWNNWTNGLYFITDKKLYNIQLLMIQMMQNMDAIKSGIFSSYSSDSAKNLPTTSIQMALAVVSVLPVLVVYPYFQRYFVKGLTLGAVKG